MTIKHFLSFFFSMLLISCAQAEKNSSEWHLLGKGKINGVSGIAVIDNEHFLVVHDRKKKEEPRLSTVSWKKGQIPVSSPLPWCDMDNVPVDLEAVTAIPNFPKQYFVLESKGKVTRIQLEDNNTCKVTAKFDLPNAVAESNMEGIGLYCTTDNCVLAWAERGDEKTAAKFSWSLFDVNGNEFKETVNSFEFNTPYPQVNQRSISDIAISPAGNVWVSSASDPSDIGTFYSAIYDLGAFVEQNSQIVWQAAKEVQTVAKYEYDNVKIEGLTFTSDALIMGSEDEILGGRISAKPLK
jgi:hypothetical protein